MRTYLAVLLLGRTSHGFFLGPVGPAGEAWLQDHYAALDVAMQLGGVPLGFVEEPDPDAESCTVLGVEDWLTQGLRAIETLRDDGDVTDGDAETRARLAERRAALEIELDAVETQLRDALASYHHVEILR
jgi:hypothetical protein